MAMVRNAEGKEKKKLEKEIMAEGFIPDWETYESHEADELLDKIAKDKDKKAIYTLIWDAEIIWVKREV
jgi:hypothetical protein